MSKKKIRYEGWFLVLVICVSILTFWAVGLGLDRSLLSRADNTKAFPPDNRDKYLYAHPSTDSLDLAKLPLAQLLLKTSRSPLTGEEVRSDLLLKTPVAVVVENHSTARPQQKGLKEADIVYETVAEGGITRFLLIFGKQGDFEVGPVRSARPYFVDWAGEYSGALAHVGGSPEALEKLSKNEALFSIDEQLDSDTIYRNKDYERPHNAFTTVARLLNRLKDIIMELPAVADRFAFETLTPPAKPVIQTISIDFSTAIYKVKYVYDTATGKYLRTVGGGRQNEVAPSNVIVQFTKQTVVDDVLRVRIETEGTGKALMFRNGEVIVGTWEKHSKGVTEFYDHNNQRIPLNPGQTWIEVVSEAMAVNYF